MQVSYHPPAEFNKVRLAIRKVGATPVTVAGSSDAFKKSITFPNGTVNDVEYVLFDNGTVVIAFTAASGFLTDRNEGAVTAAIVD